MLPIPRQPANPQVVFKTVPKTVYKQYQTYPKILIFQGEIEEKGKGQMLLIDTKTAKIDARFMARSGIGGKETAKALGPLPSNRLTGFKHYTVTLKPFYIPNNPGIKGNFYQILPYNFTFAGVNRGDFGIHWDPQGNGTLGCIGIATNDWDHFERLMKILSQSGLKKIPLLVANY